MTDTAQDFSALGSTADSQDRFLAALLALLQKKRFSEISISELCTQAQLSRKTFYKYFADKDALLVYLSETLALSFHSYTAVSSYPSDSIQHSFFHVFDYWYHLQPWVTVLIENDLWHHVTRLTDFNLNLLGKHTWSEYFSGEDERLIFMYEFVNAGCLRMIEIWCRNGFRQTPAEMTELVCHTLSDKIIDRS